MAYIRLVCLIIILSAFLVSRWKGLTSVNQCVRRGYFILISVACAIVAIDSTLTCIALIMNYTFSGKMFQELLFCIVWWFICWGIVFRQIDFSRKLWE